MSVRLLKYRETKFPQIWQKSTQMVLHLLTPLPLGKEVDRMLLGELSKVLGPLLSLCLSHCHSHISGHHELRGTEVIQFHVQFINDRYVLLG